MATKSKNTDQPNFFAGLISWVCMVFMVYGLCIIAAALLILVFTPELGGDLTNWGNYLLQEGEIPQEMTLRFTCAILLILADLLMIFIFRRDRKQFEKEFAQFLSRVWVEFKLAAIPVCIYASYMTSNFWLMLFVIMFVIYLLCLDLGHNKTFFKRNIVNSVITLINGKNLPDSYEKKARRRVVSTIMIVVSVVILAVSAVAFVNMLYTSTNIFYSHEVFIFTCLAIILFASGGIIGSISWYVVTLNNDLQDLTQIMGQIEEMYTGNLGAVNIIPPGSSFYDLAMQLNMIRTGIEKAVEEGIKADKTKVELITNVSHDIKTPLTSIITYIDLLRKETGLPPHVQDYIRTLQKKADRLSNIVQDVFEVSKAATGNIALNMENIDISKLLHQTLAEMDETMKGTLVTWRVDVPEIPMVIRADGQKLYRVFQNLIRNASQYSLEGSRAYITLKETDGNSEVIIRNIAKNELDTTAAEYLTGRFIRGDKNRTTEGSGLGLSIAKSFTEACGGKFTLRTDGDIFLVRVQFPIVQKEPLLPQLSTAELPGDTLSEPKPPKAAGTAKTAPSGDPAYATVHSVSIPASGGDPADSE